MCRDGITGIIINIIAILNARADKDAGQQGKEKSTMKMNFTPQQCDVLKKMDIRFNVSGNLDENQLLDLDTVVTDYLIENGIEEDETVNEEGKICESILKMLAEV